MSTITLTTKSEEDRRIGNTLLNRVVAQALGWKPGEMCNGPYVDYVTRFQCIRCNAQLKEKGRHEYHIPNYTENLVFAMAVTYTSECARYQIGGNWQSSVFTKHIGYDRFYHVTMTNPSGKEVTVEEETLPRALCLAYYYLVQNHIPSGKEESLEGAGVLPIGKQEEVPV